MLIESAGTMPMCSERHCMLLPAGAARLDTSNDASTLNCLPVHFIVYRETIFATSYAESKHALGSQYRNVHDLHVVDDSVLATVMASGGSEPVTQLLQFTCVCALALQALQAHGWPSKHREHRVAVDARM